MGQMVPQRLYNKGINLLGTGFSITNTDKKFNASGINVNYGTVSIGAPNGGNRVIVITITSSAPGFLNSDSVTVNGVLATPLGARFDQASAAMYYISDSTAGTSALSTCSLSVLYGEAVVSEVGVYAVLTTNPSQTPVEADNANFGSASNIAATLSIPSGGGGIAVTGTQDVAPPTTWTGMTADYDDSLAATIQASATHALGSGSTTFTANYNSAVSESFLVAAAWSP